MLRNPLLNSLYAFLLQFPLGKLGERDADADVVSFITHINYIRYIIRKWRVLPVAAGAKTPAI